MRYVIAATLPLMLIACDGPAEKAGEARDRATANAAGVEYQGDGPAERVGEAQDRTNKAAREDLDAKQDEIKTQADTQADQLEKQARQIRDDAKKGAAALSNTSAAR